MKVLIIFCDMLRANLLKTFNPEIRHNEPIDEWLERLGGTAFTNCYSPAPDTARGMACFYTGLYPKDNGCTQRVTWPEFFLREDCQTIFDLFEEKSFTIVSYIDKRKAELGFFPKRNKSKMRLFYNLNDAVSSPEINSENLLFFVALDDCHFALDDNGRNQYAHHLGQKHLANSFQIIFNTFTPNDFDTIMVFSDHGCKLGFYENYVEKHIYKLNSDRAQIVMHIREKGEKELHKNNKLTSILGAFSTFSDRLGCESENVEGISFFSEEKVNPIVIEDSSSFSPNFYNIYDLWGVRTDDNIYYTDIEQKLLYKVENGENEPLNIAEYSDVIKSYEKEISEKTLQYNERLKHNKIMSAYNILKSQRDNYSDGQNRIGAFRKYIAPLLRNPILLLRLPLLYFKNIFIEQKR